MTTPDRDRVVGASAVERQTASDDHSTKESLIGTDSPRRRSNVSWGAIFAGVATFLALTAVFGMASAAMGIDGAGGVAAGIWAVIALVIALAAAGFIAGALAVRGGLLHGFLAWAVSILAILILAGWLGGTLLGSIGGVIGGVAEQVTVSPEQIEGATDAAQDAANQADEQQIADATSAGMWWAFAGTLIGGVIAALAGMLGARSVIRRRTEVTVADRA